MVKLNRQCQQVLDYLKAHGEITKRDAMDMNIWNLPGRIFDLREKLGAAAIETVEVPNKGRGSHGVYVWRGATEQLDLLAS